MKWTSKLKSFAEELETAYQKAECDTTPATLQDLVNLRVSYLIFSKIGGAKCE